MTKLKTDLKAVTRELKALSKKTERLMKTVDKLEKARAKAKAKPKAKAPRKASAKKKAVAKKRATLSATDQVLRIIKRSKKGVGVPILTKKSGFDDIRVRNIINRTLKQGKIKRVGRGVYVGV